MVTENMYALVRARFFRKWMYISLVIVIFILGNYYLFRGQQGSSTFEKSENYGEALNPTDDAVEEVEPSRYDAEEKRKTEAREINVEVVTDPILPARNDAKDVHSPKHSQEEKSFKNFQYKIAVLVIACNRPAVSQCLDQIFKIKPQNIDMPVIVSQDCGHSETENVIQSYGNKLSLVKQPDLSDVKGVPSHMLHFMGYYKISRHYKFALEQAFKDPKIDSVIIIEDDLNIGRVLHYHFVLLCISFSSPLLLFLSFFLRSFSHLLSVALLYLFFYCHFSLFPFLLLNVTLSSLLYSSFSFSSKMFLFHILHHNSCFTPHF